jgi:hypothetical protein
VRRVLAVGIEEETVEAIARRRRSGGEVAR